MSRLKSRTQLTAVRKPTSVIHNIPTTGFFSFVLYYTNCTFPLPRTQAVPINNHKKNIQAYRLRMLTNVYVYVFLYNQVRGRLLQPYMLQTCIVYTVYVLVINYKRSVNCTNTCNNMYAGNMVYFVSYVGFYIPCRHTF